MDATDPLAADRSFFAALLSASPEALDQILTDDFILIDVMRGSQITKPMLTEAVASRQISFETIETGESLVRYYQSTAVITGSTQMTGRAGEAPFAAHSRYTHVFVEQQGRWRLASAQGTQIAADLEVPPTSPGS